MPPIYITKSLIGNPPSKGYFYSENVQDFRSLLMRATLCANKKVIACSIHVAGVARVASCEILNLNSKSKLFFFTQDSYVKLEDQINNATKYFSSDLLSEDVIGSGIYFSKITSWYTSILQTRGQLPIKEALQLRNLTRPTLIGALGWLITIAEDDSSIGKLKGLNIDGINGQVDDYVIARIQSKLSIENLCIFNSCGLVLYAKHSSESSAVKYLLFKDGIFYPMKDSNEFIEEESDKDICRVCYDYHTVRKQCCYQIVSETPKDEHKNYIFDGNKVTKSSEQHLARHVVYAQCQTINVRGLKKIITIAVVIIKTTDNVSAGKLVFEKHYSILDMAGSNEDEKEVNLVKTMYGDIDDFYNKFNADDSREAVCFYCKGTKIKSLRKIYSINKARYIYMCDNHLNDTDEKYFEHNYLPVYVYNFTAYCSNLLTSKFISDGARNIKLIGKSSNRISSIKIVMGNIYYHFKDSKNHLPGTLKMLAKNLIYTFTPGKYMKTFENVVPYDWFDCIDKLNQTLPTESIDWHSTTTGLVLTETEVTEALKYFKNNRMKNFAEYLKMCTMIDVFILAELFEEYRRLCMKEINLDPIEYHGGPAMGWYYARQLMTRLGTLPWTPPAEIYTILQKNIRGGMAQIMHRHVNKKQGAIMGFDVNTLYSSVMMSQLMPNKYIGAIDVKNIKAELEKLDPRKAYVTIYKGDIIYPPEIHDNVALRAYPPAPTQHLKRLCGTFHKKENYYMLDATKEYLESIGAVVEIKEAFVFEGEILFKDYIERNLRKRKDATNPVIKDLYKLMNNSVFGKTCENVFNYKEYRIETSDCESDKNLFHLESFMHLRDDKILYQEPIRKVTLNKCPQMGFAIVEYAKIVVYKFFDALVKQFSDIIFLYTDTDSAFFQLPGKNYYEALRDIKKSPYLKHMVDLDFNEYYTIMPPKKTPGLWSLVYPNKIINEFFGLKSRTYCFTFDDNTKKMKTTGLPVEEKNDINEEGFERKLKEWEYLFTDRVNLLVDQNENIIAKKVTGEDMVIDFKRYTANDLNTTIPWGYKGSTFEHLHQDMEEKENILKSLLQE